MRTVRLLQDAGRRGSEGDVILATETEARLWIESGAAEDAPDEEPGRRAKTPAPVERAVTEPTDVAEIREKKTGW